MINMEAFFLNKSQLKNDFSTIQLTLFLYFDLIASSSQCRTQDDDDTVSMNELSVKSSQVEL